MNIAKIKYNNISNGTGIRTSIFVSGCSHFCKGCFNKESWNKNYGSRYTDDTLNEIIKSQNNDYTSGISILGGEPFEEYNLDGVQEICSTFNCNYDNKTIWIYSGYTFEQLIERAKLDIRILLILAECDVLVDGKFEQDLYSPVLKFKGSENQRIIDVKSSLESNSIILYEL